MKIVYLKPRSSFHGTLRSDTLWGIICWGIRTIYSEEKLVQFIEKYESGEGAKISSTFPYVEKGDEKRLYFPKPLLSPLDLNEFFEEKKIESKAEKAKYIKKLKKYKKSTLVEQKVFEKFLSGELDEKSYFLSEEWQTSSKFFESEEVLHNSINRLTNTTSSEEGVGSLYTTLDLFAVNSGLFFLLSADEEDFQLINASLRYLDHIGFASDATIGKSSFKVSIQDIVLNLPEEYNSFINLSLYLPSKDETDYFSQNSDRCWYSLEARKGKFGGRYIQHSNFWKDSVLSFTEGSVFPSLQKGQYGINKIVMHKEENGKFDVYQYGISFNLPIKVK